MSQSTSKNKLKTRQMAVEPSALCVIQDWHKSFYARMNDPVSGDGTAAADTNTASHLIDADGDDWTTCVSVGDIVYNVTDETFAAVTAVAAHDLTLDWDAFPDGNEVYYIYSEPAPPEGFVECNGQTLSDSDSPFNGMVIPNLNGDPTGADSPGQGEKTGVFLRGGRSSGRGEQDQMQSFSVYYRRVLNGQTLSSTDANYDLPCEGGDDRSTKYATIGSDGYGDPRFGPETHPKTMYVIKIMRIK